MSLIEKKLFHTRLCLLSCLSSLHFFLQYLNFYTKKCMNITCTDCTLIFNISQLKIILYVSTHNRKSSKHLSLMPAFSVLTDFRNDSSRLTEKTKTERHQNYAQTEWKVACLNRLNASVRICWREMSRYIKFIHTAHVNLWWHVIARGYR